MQIGQKRLQFYPALRFLTLFCVTMLAPPRVWISRSRWNDVQCHENILRSTSLILSGAPLWLRVWRTDGSDSWSHQEHLLQRVISQEPETLAFSITNYRPAWWGSDAKGRIYKNLSNNTTLGFPTKLLCLDSAKFLFTLCLIKICWLLNGSVRLQWCPVSQGPDDVHPDFKISPRSLHLAGLLSRAILDFTRTFSRDDSRFQNIPNIFYGQDPFRSIVKSFHEIYCKAAIQHNASERGCLGQTNGPHL